MPYDPVTYLTCFVILRYRSTLGLLLPAAGFRLTGRDFHPLNDIPFAGRTNGHSSACIMDILRPALWTLLPISWTFYRLNNRHSYSVQ